MEFVTVNDVGPRDGLQNEALAVAPVQRARLVRCLLDAGVPAIEAVSFVSPAAVPNMAGADEVVAAIDLDAGDISALVPNLRGYEMARASGVRNIAIVLSATDTMNRKNINMDLATSIRVSEDILGRAQRDGIRPRAYLSVAVECPYEGTVDPAVVDDLAARMFAAGAQEVIVADTIGAANPRQIKTLFGRLVDAYGAARLAAHLHDTRALALANTWQALECGIRKFDASIGGLGGCPFAPGAAGNLATEDLVSLLHQAGFETGIDAAKLLAAVDLVAELVGHPAGGRSVAWQRNAHAPQAVGNAAGNQPGAAR